LSTFFLQQSYFSFRKQINLLSMTLVRKIQMKVRLVMLSVMVWASTGLAFSQEPQTSSNLQDKSAVAVGASPEPGEWKGPNEQPSISQGSFIYGGVDYLLWWMKPVCLKVPVLTAGSRADPIPGAVDQLGTTVLVGNSRFEFTPASGFRPLLGMLLTPDGLFAGEVEGFDLATVANHQGFSTQAGSSPTYLAYQAPDNSQQALPFSIPGVVNGSVAATGTSHLWGLEANSVANLLSNQWGDLRLQGSFLVGFRYLDLQDRITLRNTQSLVTDPSISAFGEDSLTTHNQFYGAQLGNRIVIFGPGWSIEGIGKLAFGETRLANNFTGIPLVGTPVQPGLIPGPIQVLPSNAGTQSTYRVSLVPEVAVKLRYDLSDHVILSLGYSLLYWNRILCPGDLMDYHVNTTQLPFSGPTTGALVPAVQPLHTDYFAQGINAGLEFRF